MKKFTVMFLILAMMLAVFAGCQSAQEAAPPDVQDATESTNEQMQASEVAPATTEAATGQTEDKEATTPEQSTEATEATAQKTEPTTPSATQPTTPAVTEPPHQHDYTTTTVVDPTCTAKGYTKHSCACGNSYNDNYTAALGHNLVDEVVDPTSSEQGYTKHTCERCGYSYKDSYTDPVKQVYDINSAMEKANAYALSLGFACIDYSLTPANAGYYPPSYITGDSLTRIGGQSWLDQDTMDGALSCKNNLIGIRGENAQAGCACRAYIVYNAAEDSYTIYFLYA